MQLRSGKEAAQRMHRFISSKHQVHAYSVDLTARQIYSLGPTGAVDFAGSDYLAADPHAVSAYQKHSQDTPARPSRTPRPASVWPATCCGSRASRCRQAHMRSPPRGMRRWHPTWPQRH